MAPTRILENLARMRERLSMHVKRGAREDTVVPGIAAAVYRKLYFKICLF
jgi:hypothetical protein